MIEEMMMYNKILQRISKQEQEMNDLMAFATCNKHKQAAGTNCYYLHINRVLRRVIPDTKSITFFSFASGSSAVG
jgi:hypothetical protein